MSSSVLWRKVRHRRGRAEGQAVAPYGMAELYKVWGGGGGGTSWTSGVRVRVGLFCVFHHTAWHLM